MNACIIMINCDSDYKYPFIPPERVNVINDISIVLLFVADYIKNFKCECELLLVSAYAAGNAQ